MKFTPRAVTGLGFLEAMSDQQILQNVDFLDEDSDGISGKPNYIAPPDYFEQKSIHQPVNGKIIGRFGKKAAAIDLLQQTVGAYNQDMGITSTFEPIDSYRQLSTDPEVSDQTIRDVVFYLRTLKAPIPRSEESTAVLQGKSIFKEMQCASCHIPEWTTPESDIEALSNKTFYPYTDLLLHDMGPGLDDGATEGSAETYEWRTPPLWGLGLSPNSQGGSSFLMLMDEPEVLKKLSCFMVEKPTTVKINLSLFLRMIKRHSLSFSNLFRYGKKRICQEMRNGLPWDSGNRFTPGGMCWNPIHFWKHRRLLSESA